VAVSGAVATGAVAIGTVAIGVAATGTAIGAIITMIMTSSSSAASAFRLGAGAGDIRTDIMAMAIRTDMATATMDTGTITASPVTDMAMGAAQELQNYNGDSLVPAIMVGLSMGSWDRRRGEQFGLTSATADTQAELLPLVEAAGLSERSSRARVGLLTACSEILRS
jgi:hypothetical protein